MLRMIVTCPWCKEFVEIEQLNCKIFRHGYDSKMQQIPPHASQKECELLTFYGCGRPFQIINGQACVCDYI